MLTVGGQAPEEIRAIRFRNALAESGIPLHKGKQLRELVSGVSQSTDVIPGGKCGGGEDGRVKCREDGVE